MTVIYSETLHKNEYQLHDEQS